MLLSSRKLASAMIDISDGLSSDLAHICEASGVGAVVEESLVPVDEAIEAVTSDSTEQMEFALNGGEDFELLFTVRPRKVREIEALPDCFRITEIGSITDVAGRVDFAQKDGELKALRPSGYEHFHERL
jgi:thiamine-monophosphate kinase